MSNFYQAAGYNNYGSKQQQPSQQQLNQYPQGAAQGQQQYLQGGQQLPIGGVPGVKLVSFQQDVTASFPQQQQQQQPRQESVYMGMPNMPNVYLVSTRAQNYQPQGQASNTNLIGTAAAGGYNTNYGTTQQQYQFPQGAQGQQQKYQSGGGVPIINAVGGQGSYQQGGAAVPPQFRQQKPQDSAYIGLPNELYLVSNRPAEDYHYQPRRQESNIRTAILNEDGNVVGIVEQQRSYPTQSAQQGQTQQQQAGGIGGIQGAASSVYQLDALHSGY